MMWQQKEEEAARLLFLKTDLGEKKNKEMKTSKKWKENKRKKKKGKEKQTVALWI